MSNKSAFQLGWDVFVSTAKPVVSDDRGPDGKQPALSPTSATLVYGEHDAVLVDPLMTIDESQTLRDWVVATGKNLTAIYVTHAHADHFFGARTLLERFPDARLIAHPSVVERMQQQVSPQIFAFWSAQVPGQLYDHPPIAEPLKNSVLQLEGRDLVIVPLGHTDTDETTCLHVPALDLVIAGDAVYNDVHLYLGESTPELRQAWLAALDTIEALRPRTVIAGHKRPENNNDPVNIELTRRYIRDFDRIAARPISARQLFDEMLALHPGRLNSWALWVSAKQVKG